MIAFIIDMVKGLLADLKLILQHQNPRRFEHNTFVRGMGLQLTHAIAENKKFVTHQARRAVVSPQQSVLAFQFHRERVLLVEVREGHDLRRQIQVQHVERHLHRISAMKKTSRRNYRKE